MAAGDETLSSQCGMKIDEYAVRMTSFRDHAEFRPFEVWLTNDDCLPWYQACTPRNTTGQEALEWRP